MSRFIRSALFPILIVIIVAMFIEWVISRNNRTTRPSGSALRLGTAQTVLDEQLQAGMVKSIVIDPRRTCRRQVTARAVSSTT